MTLESRLSGTRAPAYPKRTVHEQARASKMNLNRTFEDEVREAVITWGRAGDDLVVARSSEPSMGRSDVPGGNEQVGITRIAGARLMTNEERQVYAFQE